MNTIQRNESAKNTFELAASNVIPTPIELCYPKPQGHFDEFNSESIMSDILQIPQGLYIEEKEIILPYHIVCGIYDGEYFFEVIELHKMSTQYTGHYIRYSSIYSIEADGLPSAVPGSLFKIEKYLAEAHPEHHKEIHNMLIDLFAGHTLMWWGHSDCIVDRYSDCLGSCQEFAEQLYFLAERQMSLPLEYRYPTELHGGGDFYLADFKWVANTNPRTAQVEFDDDFDFVGSLSSISIDMWREEHDGPGVKILIWDADVSELYPVAEFYSESSLPHAIPKASLNAIKFASELYPDEANTIGAMVLGRTAWLLKPNDYKDLSTRYCHVTRLYEDATGLPAPTIRIDGKEDSMYLW